MRQNTWRDDGFAVTSYGNGLAYAVTAHDGRAYFVQGDSAFAWRAEYDTAAAMDRLAEFHAGYMAAIGTRESDHAAT